MGGAGLRRAVVAITFVLGLIACGDSFDWREFDWPPGDFKVLFPARPDKETGTVTIGAQELALTLFPVRAQGFSFAAGFAELPAGFDAPARARLLDEASAAFVKNIGADAPTVRTMMVAGQPGREFRGTGTREGKTRAIVGRVAATERRFYQVVVIAPVERVNDAELQLFIESLKITAR